VLQAKWTPGDPEKEGVEEFLADMSPYSPELQSLIHSLICEQPRRWNAAEALTNPIFHGVPDV